MPEITKRRWKNKNEQIKGERIKDDGIKFITPLMTRHIRHGKFEFDLERRKSVIMTNEN